MAAAFEIPVLVWGTQPAHVDLSAKQFLAVYVNSTSGVDVQTTAGSTIAGVLQNNPTAGNSCEIMTLGVTKMICGTAQNPGTAVYSDNAGKATGSAAGNNVIIGYLVDQVASVSGQLCSVMLIPNSH